MVEEIGKEKVWMIKLIKNVDDPAFDSKYFQNDTRGGRKLNWSACICRLKRAHKDLEKLI